MAIRTLHLCVLWAVAIVAPLFDQLGRHAEFFVARGNTSSDILIITFGLTLVPPLLLGLVVATAARIRPSAGETLHVVLVGVLLTLLALDLLGRLLNATAPLLLGATSVGAAGAAAYVRFGATRAFLTALGPAPAVFLASLLVFSPVRELLTATSAERRRSDLRSNTPVVLAIFDELPTTTLMNARRSIDAASFPNFGRLARTATWYRNASTVADGTQLAVPSIFSGRRPSSNLPTARRYPDSIFTLLAGQHELHVLEPITRVCSSCEHQRPKDPQSQRLNALLSDLAVVQAHLLLPRGLTEGLPPIDRDFEDFAGQEAGVEPSPRRRSDRREQRRSQHPIIIGRDLFARRVRAGERFVRRLPPPGRSPPAYIAHFIVPHVPWRLLPSGRQYAVAGPMLPGSTDRVWTRDRFLVEQAMQRHLLQTGYADRLLGRLVARLKAHGLWSRALVIVTADHGIGLRPGGSRREIKRGDFAAVAGVPLFIKWPGQRAGRVDDGPARSVDIMPTIGATLGARDWPDFDGVSLTVRDRRQRRLRVRHGRSGALRSIGFDEFVRTRDEELARQRRSFPRGLRSAFRIGPSPQLLRRPVASLRVTDGSPQVHIDDRRAFTDVDPDSGVLPTYLTGHFRGAAPSGLPLAVAVNKRIAAVGRSYFVRETTRFSMLISPSMLRRGRNVVEIFRVTPNGLARLARAPG